MSHIGPRAAGFRFNLCIFSIDNCWIVVCSVLSMDMMVPLVIMMAMVGLVRAGNIAQELKDLGKCPFVLANMHQQQGEAPAPNNLFWPTGNSLDFLSPHACSM